MTGEERRTDVHAVRHPLRRVPVLELDDGRFVFESAAICLHLGDLYPESGVLPPAGTTERALVYQWSVFAMAEVEPALFGWVRARRAGQDEQPHVERFLPVVAALRTAVTPGPWVTGETFTVADVLLGSMLGTALRRELIEDPGPIAGYVERALARPANVRAEAMRG